MNDGISPTPGWKLVPVEPSEEMLRAAQTDWPDRHPCPMGADYVRDSDADYYNRKHWAQMLAAAPTPLQAEMQKSDKSHLAPSGASDESLQPLLDALHELTRAMNLLLNEVAGTTGPSEAEPATFTRAKKAYDSAIRALGHRTPARQEERPDGEAEFEIHCNGDYSASASGPRELAWKEAMHYAAQYAQDGNVTIYEVTRREVDDTAAAPLPVQGQDTAVLNEYEQREMLGNPHALLFLLDYHDMQQDQADSMEAECVGDILRYEELRRLGAKVIASDPEIWDDEIRRRFAEPSGLRAKQLEYAIAALRASSSPTTKG